MLNRPIPDKTTEITSNSEFIEDINNGPITREEILNTIMCMKAGKAPGIDNITIELLKADIEMSIDVLLDLISTIWDIETVPDDWSKGLIVKIANKGDLTLCDNWRGITLTSVVAKVLGRVMIMRISRGIDSLLRKEQAGYRKGRSPVEQIFVLRNIIEQVLEWNSSLYLCFVDYTKAFDSVHRDTLWKIMEYYGIPPKLIRMVKAMYTNTQCAVMDSTGQTD